jgi:hypothetical protein
MKKIIYIVLALAFSAQVNAQDTATVKPASIALRLGMYDFKKTNKRLAVPLINLKFYLKNIVILCMLN